MNKEEISLREIQENYFEFIDINFGEMYRIMSAKGGNPGHFATTMSEKNQVVLEISKIIPEFFWKLKTFWEVFSEANRSHIQELESLKGVFSGDLFPSYDKNLASTCGFYVDTIILPDPFIRSYDIMNLLSDEKKVYFLLKHAMNILQYKDLALADTKIPIVLITADETYFDDKEFSFLRKKSEVDIIYHYNQLFEEQFYTLDEIKMYSQKLKKVSDITPILKNKEKLLFDSSWSDSLEIQWERQAAIIPKISEVSTAGEDLYKMIYGRMMQANDAIVRSQRFGGTILMDAKTSWQYFEWKLKHDLSNFAVSKELHVAANLPMIAESKMQWLGNIPKETLIELRKQDALPEIRELFSRGISELIDCDERNFKMTGEKLFFNITEIFKEHHKKIEEFEKKKGQVGRTPLIKSLVYGTIGVAGTFLPPEIACILGGIGALPSLRDTVSDWKQVPIQYDKLIDDEKILNRSSIGLLFNSYE